MKWENIMAVVVPGGPFLGPKRAGAIETQLESRSAHIIRLSKKMLSSSIVKQKGPRQNVNLVVSEISLSKTKQYLQKFKKVISIDTNTVFVDCSVLEGKEEPLIRDRVESSQPPEPKKSKQDEKVSVLNVLKEFRKGGTKDIACKRQALRIHENMEIASSFQQLLRLQEVNMSDPNYEAKAIAYQRILSVIRSWPLKISLSNFTLLREAHMLGDSALAKIKQILETGTCEKLQNLQNDQKLNSILDLMRIHGIGAKSAEKLASQGISSIRDLQVAVKNEQQKVSELVEFALEKTLNDELDAWTSMLVKKFVKEVVGPVVSKVCGQIGLREKFEVAGGFSREKREGHDLDILISWQKDEPIENCSLKVVDYANFEKKVKDQMATVDTTIDLVKKELMTSQNEVKIKLISVGQRFNEEKATLGGSKTLLLFAWFEGKWRRVDLVFVCECCFPFAKLGWTGSSFFERSIRQYTTEFKNDLNLNNPELQFHLSSTGLFLNNISSKTCVKAVEVSHEWQIFQFLRLQFLEPRQRCH